ncbi:hypothetical protein [Planococcus halocryophilus]|uniref:hypothetical protein n=1 Tax=Planococcus halocryophilus TaxID=1215089 RepID=UPI001F0F5B2F|nr:hypothetical protein [Planococcus halocryophilus]MCH4827675.1 hypothetical protein [Planococcus halocryophilus]
MNFEVTFTFALLVLIVGLMSAFFISKNQDKKIMKIIWGVTLMIVVAPLFSWLVSQLYGIYEKSGWAAVALSAILFPVIFLFGLIVLLTGVFQKLKDKVRS